MRLTCAENVVGDKLVKTGWTKGKMFVGDGVVSMGWATDDLTVVVGGVRYALSRKRVGCWFCGRNV